MTERETDGDRTLPGSLHSLRSEYEEIRTVYRTRREEMPEAQVKMNVRPAGGLLHLSFGEYSFHALG
jgi:hypothetical protein